MLYIVFSYIRYLIGASVLDILAPEPKPAAKAVYIIRYQKNPTG